MPDSDDLTRPANPGSDNPAPETACASMTGTHSSLDRLALLLEIALGEADVAAGRFVSQAEARRRLLKRFA